MEDEQAVSREELITLIMRQLSAYGYSDLSQEIAAHTKVPVETAGSSRLEELVALGLRSEEPVAASDTDIQSVSESGGIDVSREQHHVLAQAPQYIVWYKTKHKGAATVAEFSRDGRYIATGSTDASLKLIEVDKVRSPAAGSARREDKPVIRTLYHHEAEITGLAFHPNGLVLASCSADHTIKLFDLSVAYGKHSFQSFRDNYAYRSIAFHPSGDYLVAGGDACEVRLYNVRTGRAYLLGAGDSPDLARHSDSITRVCYSANGSLIGSASRDGSIKIWYGVSGKCVRTISRAHGGKAVTGVVFSRSSKYILSTGLDSRVRMWEAASGKLVRTYEGAMLDTASVQAVYSHDEALVMVPDSKSCEVVSWDAVTGTLVARGADHKQRITWIAASPTTPALMTCSVDECVRFWCSDSM
ncbi:hypothetical protein GGI23_001619 [Coemansia sp. RSA 2559]|nr:hypothetical protein GGI23_001619 [Coemansia sp. RSA 2559]KAJ2865889.1 hypothetical protein GGI22_001405 [Coemansia erecta]